MPELELHADFMAGWYLGTENRRTDGRFANMDVAVRSLFAKGSYEFNSPTFHGTPEARVSSLKAGYALGLDNVDLADASDQAIAFVRRINLKRPGDSN